MPNLGVLVQTSQTPPSSINTNSTANAFFVGIADWGSSGSTGVNTAYTSMAQAAAAIGGPQGAGTTGYRTATNAALYDALDAYFREGGSTAYISRVLGAASNTAATLVIGPSAALTLTATNTGVGGNNIYVVVNNPGSTAQITLQDVNGNTLAQSPVFSSWPSTVVSWAASTGLVTAVTSGSTLPTNTAATQMTGGTNGTTPTITQWTTAINSFGANLGPGQILAPGQTNTSLSGIWAALANHASANNRIAILDETDNASVSTVQTDITTAALTTSQQGYCGIWAGNLNIPGITPGTTRSVPPSPVIAALCARVDATGNPNLAPAGQNFALQYATSPTSTVSGSNSTYSLTDAGTLNASGVNTFQNRFGIMESYGLASALLSSSDAIYWQFNHARMRMTLVWQAQILGEPFVFSQLDGQGSDIASSDIAKFNSAIQAMLLGYYNAGALYGQNATDAFTVNTTAAVNTPTLLASGQLTAQVAVRLSPDAQLVVINLNAVPITQSLTQTASPAQNQ